MAEQARDHLTIPQYVADFETGAVDARELATDILVAVRHFCDQEGIDYDVVDGHAYGHYVAERRERLAER